jgi:hypothetical protein
LFLPSYLPLERRQCLKALVGAARAGIIAAELFVELFIAMNDALPAFYMGFRRIAFSPFAGEFKSGCCR